MITGSALGYLRTVKISDILGDLNAAVNGAEIKKGDAGEFHDLICGLSRPVLEKYGLAGGLYTWGVSMYNVIGVSIHEKCAQHLFMYSRDFQRDGRYADFGGSGRFSNFVWTLGSQKVNDSFYNKTVGEYIDFQVALSINKKLAEALKYLVDLDVNRMTQQKYCKELETELSEYKHVDITLGIE